MFKMQLPGDEPRVPVMKPPETSLERMRELSRTVEGASASLESEQDAMAALSEVGQVGAGSLTLPPSVFGDL